MKIKILILFIFIATGFKTQNVIYHFKKLKAAEGTMKKGQKEGKWIFWSYLGYPLKEENYKNGILNGNAVYYKTDESDMSISSKDEMIKNKEVYSFRLKRQKAFTENKEDWKMLLKNNYFFIDKVVYYAEGKIDTVSTYVKNRFKEQILFPYADTSNYVIRSFSPYSYRDSVNKIIEETSYRKGQKNGFYKKYNTKYNDEIMASGFYLNNKKDSIWLSEKDNVKEITRYKEGSKNGLYEKYKYRSCIDSALYINGKKEGLCKSYRKEYGSKNKDTSFTYSYYSNGKPNGTQITYKGGKIMEIANYKDYERHGEQTTFYENGNMRKQGFFKNGKRDSTLQYWGEKKDLRSYALYRKEEMVKEEYYTDGKLSKSFVKNGENVIDIKYYPDGKKRRQTEKTPTKITVTTWDEKGKKEVKVTDRTKTEKVQDWADMIEASTKTAKDYSKEEPPRESGYDDDDQIKSKYDKYNKYKTEKKTGDYGKAMFKGGEDDQKDFLNLMTKNDKREGFPEAFYLQCAITVNTIGEITYVKVENKEKRKVKKKFLKDAERIVLEMPKWIPAKKADLPVTENTGFNMWFSEKK